eukprot:TRINITY_DN22336_c0_g1_i1.p3 TRINITY_DN22336_c0_g1~~TRINITY_DN22336_c0_g1_i1.p3  ORF type:complete len:158 (+),score=32.82 TRINITY_DN22336_c0_g1_i1:45-518(+)
MFLRGGAGAVVVAAALLHCATYASAEICGKNAVVNCTDLTDEALCGLSHETDDEAKTAHSCKWGDLGACESDALCESLPDTPEPSPGNHTNAPLPDTTPSPSSSDHGMSMGVKVLIFFLTYFAVVASLIFTLRWARTQGYLGRSKMEEAKSFLRGKK